MLTPRSLFSSSILTTTHFLRKRTWMVWKQPRNGTIGNSSSHKLLFIKKNKTTKIVLGKDYFLLNVPAFLIPTKKHFLSFIGNRKTENTALSLLPKGTSFGHPSHGFPGRHQPWWSPSLLTVCSPGWWRGWEEPNTKQGCSGSEMSGGREPRTEDRNTLQVPRDLPATL